MLCPSLEPSQRDGSNEWSQYNVSYENKSKAISVTPSYLDHCSEAAGRFTQFLFPTSLYSLIQMKCQGGNKYALSITVKFDQSTRRFGRISFARLFKLTKHIALLLYLLSPYLLS